MNVSPLMLTAKDDELLGVPNRSDAMGVLAVWSVRGRDLVPHLTEQTTNDTVGVSERVRAHTTKNVDLEVVASPDDIIGRLRAAARRDLGDFMVFWTWSIPPSEPDPKND